MGGGFLVGGREGAKLGDGSGDGVECELNFGGGGVAAEAEAETGFGFVVREADRGENVRRFDRAGRTGGADGTGNPFYIERDDERFALDAGEQNVRGIGSAWGVRAVDARIWDAFEQAAFELIAQRGDAGAVGRERLLREFGGFAEADDAGDVFCTGTEAALMMAAVEKLLDFCAGADVESADAFGAVEFVRGKREQVGVESADVDGNFSCGLDSVGVKWNFVFFRDAANFGERLDDAELVVGVHHGDKRGFGAKRGAETGGINEAFATHGELSNSGSLLFNGLTGVQNRFMFDDGANDVRRKGS